MKSGLRPTLCWNCQNYKFPDKILLIFVGFVGMSSFLFIKKWFTGARQIYGRYLATHNLKSLASILRRNGAGKEGLKRKFENGGRTTHYIQMRS
jgi:hypothetical protein